MSSIWEALLIIPTNARVSHSYSPLIWPSIQLRYTITKVISKLLYKKNVYLELSIIMCTGSKTLLKQGVALKNRGYTPNGWNGETLSEQGVALKNVG